MKEDVTVAAYKKELPAFLRLCYRTVFFNLRVAMTGCSIVLSVRAVVPFHFLGCKLRDLFHFGILQGDALKKAVKTYTHFMRVYEHI